MATENVSAGLGSIQMDATTLDVLVEGRWRARVMTKPSRLTTEELRSIAQEYAGEVEQKLKLEETPEIAVRNCRGLNSHDGSKRSILVRHMYNQGRVRTDYALLSCLDTEDHCLLLFRGQVAVEEAFEALLGRHFHCQVSPLQLTTADLFLFFATWVRHVPAPPDRPLKLKMTHPVVTHVDLGVTFFMEKCISALREAGLEQTVEISEDDAQRFVEVLCQDVIDAMSLDFFKFSCKSVHTPMGSLHRAGRTVFYDRGSVASVLWYLTKVADSLL